MNTRNLLKYIGASCTPRQVLLSIDFGSEIIDVMRSKLCVQRRLERISSVKERATHTR